MNKLFKILISISIISLIFLKLFSGVYAESSYYRSLVSYGEDRYLQYGSEEYPRNIENGINLTIDHTSISFDRVHMTFTLDYTWIDDRNITKFLILWNDRVVEEVYPYRTKDWAGNEIWSNYYYVSPTDLEYTNSYLNVRVVAIEEVYNPYIKLHEQFAVAWSSPSETFRLKPLPVVDNNAVWWLEQQFYKLQEILEKLTQMDNKLSKISDQLESMLTPSQQAQERLENAQNELWEKMPMKEMAEQTNQISNMITNTATQQEYSQLTFGNKRDWFGVGVQVNLFDVSEFLDEIKVIRRFMQAIIWIEFFMFLLNYLAPKLDI